VESTAEKYYAKFPVDRWGDTLYDIKTFFKVSAQLLSFLLII